MATAAEIDHVAEEFVPAGPFFVMNMTNGNHLTYEINTLQMEQEGACYKPPLILLSVDVWKTKKPGAPMEISEATRNTVRDRLMGIVFSQSFDIIDRGVGTLEDLNFGIQVALAFRKGPMDYMRDFGETEVARIMNKLKTHRPGYPTAKKPYGEYQRFNRYLLVDDIDGIKVITMRRPQALNAINDEMRDELTSTLKQFRDDPDTKGFILTGYGTTAFSAGADIGGFPKVLGDRGKGRSIHAGSRRVAARYRQYGETGRGCRQRHRDGRRTGTGYSLPQHCCNEERKVPVPGDHPRHFPRFGRGYCPVPEMAQRGKAFPRHDLSRQARQCKRGS